MAVDVLHTIQVLKVFVGDVSAILELSSSWQEAFGAILCYSHPTAQMFDFQ